MKTIIALLKKYKSIVSYLFFGVATTVINVISYSILYEYLHIANVPSVIIAWFFAVTFAYITNKLFVFESKAAEGKALLREILSFFGCRILTGLMDVGIMYLAVDLMQSNATMWKFISNIFVIVFNYIASKLIIFNANKKTK